MDDLSFLGRRHLPGVDAQGDAVLFSEVSQDRLLVGGGRILTECPNTAVGVAADEVVGVEFNYGGRDHVQKILNMDIRLHGGLGLCFTCHMVSSFLILHFDIKSRHICDGAGHILGQAWYNRCIQNSHCLYFTKSTYTYAIISVLRKRKGSMTLQQLKYIVTVAECGSINEAAKQLFISQPSLSNAIKEVELEAKRTLFLRTPRGMQLTEEGMEFLGYARQVLQQMDMLEGKYLNEQNGKQRFSVSTQHYTFAANALVELVKQFGGEVYDFTLHEGTTHDIIENVKNLRSDLGIIYLSYANETVIRKLLSDNDLIFKHLFTAKPHVFLFKNHPLASKDIVTLDELENYPYITYNQGIYNSFYYSEEILSTRTVAKQIRVSDRAAVVNFIIGLNAYTISSGVFPAYLHGNDIIAIQLDVDEKIEIGTIMHKDIILNELGHIYLTALEKYAEDI